MNRIEFMAELESLLQDISAEERDEAVQYYRDYFEDAGAENEMQIIAELGSPQKLAKTIKAGLLGRNEENSEYRETGYADTRFEEREIPAKSGEYTYGQNANAQNATAQSAQAGSVKKGKSDMLLKILLIIAIIVIGAPVILPIAAAVLAVIAALLVSGFVLLGALVMAAAAVAVSGLIAAIAGIAGVFVSPGFGLLVCGAGLLLLVVGMIGTVLLVKACIIVFPLLFRGIVNLFRRLFHRKENV